VFYEHNKVKCYVSPFSRTAEVIKLQIGGCLKVV